MIIFKQGDSSSYDLRAHGCAAYAMVNGYGMVSGGEVSPTSVKAASKAAWTRVDRSGATRAEFRARGLTMREVAASLAAIVRRDERPALKSQLQRGVKVMALLRQLADEDAVAVAAVNYGVAQDDGVGVGKFRGGHGIVVFDPDFEADTVGVADSLRRSTRRWKISTLVRAMETFGKKPWGNGRGEAVVMWTWKTYRTLMFEARAQRDTARASLKACQADLAECRATQPPTADQLREARASGIRDAAANAAATRV